MCKPYQLLPVRQIAIDDNWNALRFRKTVYIKNTVRKTTLEKKHIEISLNKIPIRFRWDSMH